MEKFKMIAKTLAGLEEILAKEIEVLGGTDIVIGTRMVSYEGDKELLYKSNLWLRTALRVLVPVEIFQAGDPDELYNKVKSIDWSEYVAEGQTIAIDNTIFSENFRNSRYAIYRTKDAICDWFVEKGMKRPKIAVASADVQLNLHIADTAEAQAQEGRSQVTLSLDASGEPLYKRGYKEQQTDAPISEVLAAGILLKAGWDGQRDLFDPMCGSGTFLIEAALIATNTPAGIYRNGFGFQRWTEGAFGFDEDLWQELYDDDSREQEFKFHIYGADISKVAIEATQQNVKSAGLSKYISLEVRDFEQTAEVPESDYTKQLKAEGQTAPSLMLITNPPYGRRLFTDVPTFYRMMGSVLKKQFQGAEAWIISSEEKVTVKDPRTGLKTEVEPFDYIGLKPSVKINLNNGGIDCQLRKYELFSGKFDAFRAEGKSLEKKTADEKEDSKFEREHKPAGKRPFKKEGKDGKFEKKEGKFGRKDGKPDRKDSKPRRTKDAGTERSYTVRKDGSIVAKDKFEKKDRKPFGKDSKKPFDKDRKPFDKEGKKPFRKKEEGEKKPAPRKRREFDPNRPMFSPDTDMSKLVLDYSQPAHNDEKKD
ncbi:MAG: RNA methyltransferase [Bacteroidales bacterium]|nr:RNA methyltransferase [Bacteroidales bacterium]